MPTNFIKVTWWCSTSIDFLVFLCPYFNLKRVNYKPWTQTFMGHAMAMADTHHYLIGLMRQHCRGIPDHDFIGKYFNEQSGHGPDAAENYAITFSSILNDIRQINLLWTVSNKFCQVKDNTSIMAIWATVHNRNSHAMSKWHENLSEWCVINLTVEFLKSRAVIVLSIIYNQVLIMNLTRRLWI